MLTPLPVRLQVGRFIQWQGGVVTAEQLAPFLDAPKQQDRDSTTVDEGFVVPALVRFGGSPEVDERGNLLYRFPDLQKTGRMEVRRRLLMLQHVCICRLSLLL